MNRYYAAVFACFALCFGIVACASADQGPTMQPQTGVRAPQQDGLPAANESSILHPRTAVTNGHGRLDSPLPHLVIQCPISHGAANRCESFVVSGNPQPAELGEATASVPFLVIACTLVDGEAEYCTRSYTPVGDQIIAP